MRTPRSARRTAIRQPRAVLPGPYSFSVAALSLRMSKTSGASVCIRYAVSIDWIAASSFGSLTASLAIYIHNDKFTLTEQRRELDLLESLNRMQMASEAVELAALLGQRELVVVDVGDQRLRVEVLADERLVCLLLSL